MISTTFVLIAITFFFLFAACGYGLAQSRRFSLSYWLIMLLASLLFIGLFTFTVWFFTPTVSQIFFAWVIESFQYILFLSMGNLLHKPTKKGEVK